MERVRRTLYKRSKSNNYSEALIKNDDVVYYTGLENGSLDNIEQNPDYAYYLISQGKLKEAETFIENNEDYKPFIIRALAVSKGASTEIVERALNLASDKGINYDTAWMALGLAIQRNKEQNTYKDVIVKMGVDALLLNNFIRQVKNRAFANAEALLVHQGFEFKAHFYILANVILKNKAPERWKENMQTVLFVNQRPFI